MALINISKKSVLLTLLVVSLFLFEVPLAASAAGPIKVGKSPWGIAYDSANKMVYVANNGGTISVISAKMNTVVNTIKMTGKLGEIAFDSKNQELYAAVNSANKVLVIKGTKVVTSITVGKNPMGVAVDTANNEIFVSNQGSASISVISGATNKVKTTFALPAGAFPWSIAVDTHVNWIYVASTQANSVLVLSISTGALIGSPIGVGAPKAPYS
jgi:YVTN family beta-propeller protein